MLCQIVIIFGRPIVIFKQANVHMGNFTRCKILAFVNRPLYIVIASGPILMLEQLKDFGGIANVKTLLLNSNFSKFQMVSTTCPQADEVRAKEEILKF